MNYFPTMKSLSQQTIITVVSLVVAGLIISKIPALRNIVNPS